MTERKTNMARRVATPSDERVFKMVLVGDPGVGKTALLERLTRDQFHAHRSICSIGTLCWSGSCCLTNKLMLSVRQAWILRSSAFRLAMTWLQRFNYGTLRVRAACRGCRFGLARLSFTVATVSWWSLGF